MLAGAASILAVVAFAGEDQDQVPWPRQAQRVAGDAISHAANDFSFGLAGGPGGLLPVAHLSNADYRNGHGVSLQPFGRGESRNGPRLFSVPAKRSKAKAESRSPKEFRSSKAPSGKSRSGLLWKLAQMSDLLYCRFL